MPTNPLNHPLRFIKVILPCAVCFAALPAHAQLTVNEKPAPPVLSPEAQKAREDEFVKAVAASDSAKIKEMLALTPALANLKKQYGVPILQDALVQAALKSNTECLELIVAAGADINVRRQDLTPLQTLLLMEIPGSQKEKPLLFLLSKGADYRPLFPDGGNLLHAACGKASLAVYEKLLGLGLDINAVDKLGNTPLHRALSSYGNGTLDLLLAHGAKVNVQNARGETPLFLAASRRAASVQALAKAGADVNMRDAAGTSPLMQAYRIRFENTSNEYMAGRLGEMATLEETLRQLGARDELVDLLEAVESADAAAASRLLPATLNATNPGGLTPKAAGLALSTAVRLRDKAIIDLLMSRGADVNAGDEMGRPPLYFAIATSQVDVGRALLKAGANPNAEFKRTDSGEAEGVSLLDKAYRSENVELLLSLIAQGADIKDKGYQQYPGGQFLLAAAARDGNLELARLLLDKGVSPAAYGAMPFALSYDNREIFDALFEKYAALPEAERAKSQAITSAISIAMDKPGNEALVTKIMGIMSPAQLSQGLAYAVSSDSKEYANLFLEKGAPIKDATYGSRVASAISNRNRDMAEYLIGKGGFYSPDQEKDAIFNAVAAGDLAKVRELVEGNANLATITNKDGTTPLHLAAFFGRREVAELLLQKGADSMAPDYRKQTPLHWSVFGRDAALLKLLLDQPKADVDVRDDSGQTPLLLACAQAGKEIVTLLLDRGANTKAPDAKEASSGNVESALNRAAYQGNTEAMECLIARGVDVNEAGSPNTRPVDRAVEGNQLAALRLLVAKGAALQQRRDPADKKTDNAPVLLQRALWSFAPRPDLELSIPRRLPRTLGPRDPMGVVKFLLENKPDGVGRAYYGLTPLGSAVIHGDTRVVGLLLDSGLDVNNSSNRGGATPLHLAVEANDKAMVEFLLGRDAKVNTEDSYCRTPLDFATRHGEWSQQRMDSPYITRGYNRQYNRDVPFRAPRLFPPKLSQDIAAILVAHGGRSGSGPFFSAVQQGAMAAVREALKENPDFLFSTAYFPNDFPTHGLTKYPSESTPVTEAIRKHQLAMAEFLLKSGAALNQDKLGRSGGTPLHAAALNGDWQAITFLLQHGADASLLDNQGRTPLHAAISRYKWDIASFMVESGVDPNGLDSYGRTPLAAAKYDKEAADFRKVLQDKGGKEGIDLFGMLGRTVAGADDEAEKVIAADASWAKRRTYEGDTFLHIAVRRKKIKAAASLIDQGAEVNALNSDRKSPLGFALENGDKAMAQLLLDKGADINYDPNANARRDEDGKILDYQSPVIFSAVYKNDTDIMTLLLDHGAKLDVKDFKGRTPLKVAVEEKKDAVAELLRQRGAKE